MKILLGGVLLATLVLGVSGQERRTRMQETMRLKLEQSQRILEGLSLENYGQIAKSGQKLKALTYEARWRVFDNPNYARQSENFRRSLDALLMAAKENNLDGATLAYMRLTMNCVECHQSIRGKESAATDSETQVALKAAERNP